MRNIKFIFLFISCLFSLHLSAQNEYKTTKTESPYFKSPNNDKDLDDLPLKSTKASVKIVDIIADVTIEQTYTNQGNKPIEAIYVFPMSDKAAVYSLEMYVGTRVIKAVIKEKNAARTEYENAKSDGYRASLMEQERPNVFTMNVANINPSDTIKVVVRYTEFILPDEGVYSFVFPTVVGPRYNTKGSKASFAAQPYSKSGEKPTMNFALDLSLLSNIPISSASCKTHKIIINKPNERTASLSLTTDEILSANRDFILNYTLKGKGIESGVQLYDHGNEKFFMALIQPPKRVVNDEIPPREYIFIVDISGSMHGFPLGVSKKLLSNLISNLKSSDRFNVVLFAGSAEVMSPTSLTANKLNIESAIRFIDNYNGGGSTELLGALQTSLNLPRASKSLSRSAIIVTDGYVTVEKEAMDLIKNNLNTTNVFAFGIGGSVNRYLINGLAHAGGGLPFVITEESEADSIATKFRKYIQTPVLSNIKVTYEGIKPYDLIYEKLPDLMAERPVVIIGKYTGKPEGKIKLSGNTGKGKFNKEMIIDKKMLSEDHNAIRYFWAREKIQGLSDYGDSAPDSHTISEITKLGLNYNLMTEYTSFVAVDKQQKITREGKLDVVEQVLPMPQGVSNYAIGADFNMMGSFLAVSPGKFDTVWLMLFTAAFILLVALLIRNLYLKAHIYRDFIRKF
ncbi:MAG: VWA domain-containing protein [Saprospiraceae bacterium]|nr:VWA domain-containing protein [Saprospiraceae bacterium]